MNEPVDVSEVVSVTVPTGAFPVTVAAQGVGVPAVVAGHDTDVVVDVLTIVAIAVTVNVVVPVLPVLCESPP